MTEEDVIFWIENNINKHSFGNFFRYIKEFLWKNSGKN